MKAGHSFGSAVRWNFVGSAARVVLTLCCQLALLRLLGPEIAGKFAIFLTIVGCGTILSEGGMMAALTRAPELTTDTLRSALFVVLCYAAVVAAVLLALTHPLMRLFHLSDAERYIPWIAVLNIVPLGLSSVPLSMLRREYRARDVQLIQTGAYALGFAAVALPLTFFYASVGVMIAAFSVQTAATLAGGFWLARCPVIPRMRGGRAVQSASWRALIGNIIFYLNENAATVLTANMIGIRAVGLYGTAFNLLRMPTDVLVTTLHAPLLVSAAQENDGGATRTRFLTTFNVLTSTAFAVFFTVYLTGSQLLVPLLGSKWIDAGPVLSVVGLIMMARLLSMLSGAVAWGSGRLIADAGAQALSFAVVVLGFLALRPSSAEEVAWIVLASVGARMIMQLAIAMRACAITARMLWANLVLPLLMTAVVMLPIVWITPLLLPRHGLLGFVGVGAAAGALLVLRLGLGLWLTPTAWNRSLFARLPILTRHGGHAETKRPALRELASPNPTVISLTEVP